MRREVNLSREQIMNIINGLGGAWIHDGNPESPHAQLTSGLCSNAYFNMSVVSYDVMALDALCYNLAKKILPLIGGEKIVIVGSAYAGIPPSLLVALHLGVNHAYVEKGLNGEMVWTERVNIPEDAYVLQVEDIITTFNTAESVRKTIVAKNKNPVRFYPFVATVVHRPVKLPAEYFFNGEEIKIISLIEQEVWAVSPENCPLCAQGSLRLPLKKHWEELARKS